MNNENDDFFYNGDKEYKSGYQPKSYEDALKDRAKLETARDINLSGDEFEYLKKQARLASGTAEAEFTPPAEKEKLLKQRYIGIAVAAVGVLLTVVTFFVFLIINESDGRLLSKERVYATVTELTHTEKNSDTSRSVKVEYTYDGEHYEESAFVRKPLAVGDMVAIYVNKNAPCEIIDAELMSHKIDHVKDNVYEIDLAVFIIGVVIILYSIEGFRGRSSEVMKKKRELSKNIGLMSMSDFEDQNIFR